MGTDPKTRENVNFITKEDGIHAPSTEVMEVMVIIIISIILTITSLI